jgi:hypothetical protein
LVAPDKMKGQKKLLRVQAQEDDLGRQEGPLEIAVPHEKLRSEMPN